MSKNNKRGAKAPRPQGGYSVAHKGGRSVKKSTDVTPATAAILAELKENGISLGDLVEWAAKNYKHET